MNANSTLFWIGCSSVQPPAAEARGESNFLQEKLEISKDLAPFRECIEEPTKMFHYAVGEWAVKSIAVMPDAEQRVYPSEPMLTKEELAAIREARFTIREGEVQNIGLNPAGWLCAGQGLTQVGSAQYPWFPDPFVEMGIDPRVRYVYYIVIDEERYVYFLVNFDELLATPLVLIDTAIGRIRLPEAHYVIFQKVNPPPSD